MAEHTMTIDDRQYAVERAGDELRVVPVGADELAESVSLNHLSDAARQAVDNGDYDDAALQIALEGVARGIADRGA